MPIAPILSTSGASRKPGAVQALVREARKPCPNSGILFELRFAYEMARLGLSPEYEHETGVDQTSVDFRLTSGADDPAWNVELVSLDQSDAVGRATTIATWSPGLSTQTLDLGLFGGGEEDARRIAGKQTPEHEMLRAISALEKKVFDAKRARPIKFPVPDGSVVNMLLVDLRRYEGFGFPDRDHCRQIVGGSEIVEHDFNVLSDPVSTQPIRGLWSADNNRPGARTARERLQLVGFVHEEVYGDDEIREVTVLFANPFLARPPEYPLRWSTASGGPRTALRQTNALWNSG